MTRKSHSSSKIASCSSAAEDCSRGSNLTVPPPKRSKQTSITSFFQTEKQNKEMTSKSHSVIKPKEMAKWKLSNGKEVDLNDSVKKLPGIGKVCAENLLAEKIETIHDLKKVQLKCKREPDEDSFIKFMKQVKLSGVNAIACETELNKIPMWASLEIKKEINSDTSNEIKEEHDSDSDDVIYIGDFPFENDLQTTPKYEPNTKIKEEKFHEVIEIIDLDLFDDDNPQNLNPNQPPSHSSSAVSETRENELNLNAQSADANPILSPELTSNGNSEMDRVSNLKSMPTTSVSGKQPDTTQSTPLRIKPVSELNENYSNTSKNNHNSASTSKNKPFDQVTESNEANIREKPVEPSHSRENLQQESESSRQLENESDEIQNSNLTQGSPIDLSPHSNQTTKVQSLPQEKESGQKNQCEDRSESNNADVQLNRKSLPDSNLPISPKSRKRKYVRDNRVTKIAEKLLNQSIKKMNVSHENENSNQLTPSTSSEGNSSVQDSEQTRVASTISDQHSENQEGNSKSDNANAQTNRESLPGPSSSMTCSNQGSSTPSHRINKSSTVQSKRIHVIGITDRLLKKRSREEKNKSCRSGEIQDSLNLSNENENFNQVITPSTSSMENCDKNLNGNNSSESLVQTVFPSTSSNQHAENHEIESSSNMNPEPIENNLAELYTPNSVIFPGMLSTNHNNEDSNNNIDNTPASAPESAQEVAHPRAPRQTPTRKRVTTPENKRLNKVKKLSNGTLVTPKSDPVKLTGVGPEGSVRLKALRIKSIGALKKKQKKLGRAFVVWLEDVVKFERSNAEVCEKLLKEIRWRL